MLRTIRGPSKKIASFFLQISDCFVFCQKKLIHCCSTLKINLISHHRNYVRKFYYIAPEATYSTHLYLNAHNFGQRMCIRRNFLFTIDVNLAFQDSHQNVGCHEKEWEKAPHANFYTLFHWRQIQMLHVGLLEKVRLDHFFPKKVYRKLNVSDAFQTFRIATRCKWRLDLQ